MKSVPERRVRITIHNIDYLFDTQPVVGAATGEEDIMPVITLPDGSQRSYEQPLSVLDLSLIHI